MASRLLPRVYFGLYGSVNSGNAELGGADGLANPLSWWKFGPLVSPSVHRISLLTTYPRLGHNFVGEGGNRTDCTHPFYTGQRRTLGQSTRTTCNNCVPLRTPSTRDAKNFIDFDDSVRCWREHGY